MLGYIDPGQGSLLLQLLMAVFIGGVFYFKSILNKIGRLFKKKKNDEH